MARPACERPVVVSEVLAAASPAPNHSDVSSPFRSDHLHMSAAYLGASLQSQVLFPLCRRLWAWRIHLSRLQDGRWVEVNMGCLGVYGGA